MINLFHGENTFESYHAAKKFADSFAHKQNNIVTLLEIDELLSVEEFTQHTDSVGLFAESKIIFAKRLFKNKLILEFVTENFEYLSQQEIIIWEDSKIPSNRKLYKLINKEKNVQYFKPNKFFDTKQWLHSEIKKRKLENFNNIITILIERVGENQWLLLQELEKLEIANNQNILKSSNIETFLPKSFDFDIWKFINLLSSRNRKQAYKELEKILEQKDPQYVISMIRRELFIMSLVYQSSANDPNLRSLRVHPFAFQKAKKLTRNFSWQEIKRMTNKLLDLDFSIKQGEIKGKLGLILFLQLL